MHKAGSEMGLEKDLEALKEQLGRTLVAHDVAAPVPMRGMSVAFNRQDEAPGIGSPIPLGWHAAYFLPATPAEQLNDDGTPRDNGVLPEMPLPRRMHVGTSVRFIAPIWVGDTLRRENKFSGIELREGRSGSLLVSTQTRSIFTPRGLALEEDFKQAHLPVSKPTGAPKNLGETPPSDAMWEKIFTPNAINLFRYSALTFNPHRIHYDRSYAMDVEKFPGLVVHGMYTAQCLIDLARDCLPSANFTSFTFRAIQPLFESNPIRLIGRLSTDNPNMVELFAVNPDGQVATRANMTYA